MIVCRALDCLHNSREEEERGTCTIEPEINGKAQCLSFKMDFPWLTDNRNQAYGINDILERRTFENLVLQHAYKLQRIMSGARASKILTIRESKNLQNNDILLKNGNYLEVTVRAQATLERNGK